MRASFLIVMLSLAWGACSNPPPDPPPPPGSRRPPLRPEGILQGERRFLVLKTVRLGGTRPDGQPDANAWKSYGYDLDRRATTREDSKLSRNSCRRRERSPTNALQDGLEGIDNNFGQHLMSLMKIFPWKDVQHEEVANREMASGGYTLVLRLDGVGVGDNARAPGALYAAGPHTGRPTFTGDDRWPIWSTTLVDGANIDRPIRTFPLGYVRDGVWVSGEIGDLPDRMWIPWIPIFRTVELLASVVLTVDLATGTGVVAGAIPVKEVARAAAQWSGFCANTQAYDHIVSMFTESADLVTGARDLQDTARECDAISVGIGFDLVPVAPPTEVVVPPPPPPTPSPECTMPPTDAGADG